MDRDGRAVVHRQKNEIRLDGIPDSIKVYQTCVCPNPFETQYDDDTQALECYVHGELPGGGLVHFPEHNDN